MTAATNVSSSPPVPVVRRAVAAEWLRLRTVRSTWLALLAGVALVLAVAAAAGASHDAGGPAPIWVPAEVAMLPAQFAFYLVGLLAVTSEHTTGAIRSTLQWTPRRSALLVARVAVPLAVAVLAAVAAAAAAGGLAWLLVGPDAEVVVPDVAASLGRVALVVGFGSAVTIGAGLLLRSTAGALTVVFLLMLVLPIALGNAGAELLTTISDHLPGRVVILLLGIDEAEPGSIHTAVTAIAWSATALGAGAWSLLQRDTT